MVHAVVLGNQGIKIAKYHEAVNMTIKYAISRPFGCIHTPRSCMLSTVAGALYKTPNRSWDGRWEVDLNSCPVLMMTSMKTLMNDVHWDCWESLLFSAQRRCTAIQFRPLAPNPEKEAVSQVKKKSAILKLAMTEGQKRWPKKKRYTKTKSHWAATCWERGWTKLA